MSESGARSSLGPEEQSVEMMGLPQASASSNTLGNPSTSELSTKQSLLHTYLNGFLSKPQKITLLSIPRSFTFCLQFSSSTPPPTNISLHGSFRRMKNAWMSNR